MARTLTLVSALAACAGAAAGCRASAEQRAREYMPDMVRGPAYKAFAPNPATGDGMTLRAPVVGTLARGQRPFNFGDGESEAVRAGLELTNPFAGANTPVEEGGALYRIYCALCHGDSGRGDGPLAKKIPPPPSYQSQRLLAFSAGRMFHVITRGAGKMPSYAGQLSSDERWKVVAYVNRVLQGRSP